MKYLHAIFRKISKIQLFDFPLYIVGLTAIIKEPDFLMALVEPNGIGDKPNSIKCGCAKCLHEVAQVQDRNHAQQKSIVQIVERIIQEGLITTASYYKKSTLAFSA